MAEYSILYNMIHKIKYMLQVFLSYKDVWHMGKQKKKH
ncbi:hypothetical protein C823_007912 [Eubacterium plexicaudatum ASF492]|nr:hypothetical protein C823_007912 [Eubacterium plexicaudatum ASF492]